jgi:hypothetical protein
MGNQGSLRLTLVKFQGEPLGEEVEIRLSNTTITDNRVVKAMASQPILIRGLEAFPNGLYEVGIFPATFEIQSRFVNITPDETSELCIVFHGRKEKEKDDEDEDEEDEHEPPKIPPRLDETALKHELTVRLAGSPADGSTPAAQLPQKVIWVDQGDEVLVHLDSTRTRILNGTVLVSVDLETDQTGRTPLIVSFALGSGSDNGGLIAATDELPRGNGLLAARWGKTLQAAVWASILGIAQDFGAQQNGAPRAVTIANGLLNLQAGPRLQASAATPPPEDD